MKPLWVIDYECPEWCGGQSYCLVWAEDEDEARDEAAVFMDEQMRELFVDEIGDAYSEDEDYDDIGPMYAVNSVELATESDNWEFISNYTQQINFYPLVNPDAGGSLESFICDFNQTWPFPLGNKP